MTDQKPIDRFDECVEEIKTRVSQLPDLLVPTDGPDDRVFSWHIGELSEDQAVTLAKIKVDVGRLFDLLAAQQATITELRKDVGRLRETAILCYRFMEGHKPGPDAAAVTNRLYKDMESFGLVGKAAALSEQPGSKEE